MINNDSNPDKSAGFRSVKPVTVELNGQTIDANHHITSENNRLLHLYLADRADGIDVTVPLCSDKPAYARSVRGREALGLVTDGGHEECEKCERDIAHSRGDFCAECMRDIVVFDSLSDVRDYPGITVCDECDPGGLQNPVAAGFDVCRACDDGDNNGGDL